jgi:hypothetical protein
MFIARLFITLLFASISINAMEEGERERLDIESQQLTRSNYSVTTHQWYDSWHGKIIKFFGDFNYPSSSCYTDPEKPDEYCDPQFCVALPWNAFVVSCAGLN